MWSRCRLFSEKTSVCDETEDVECFQHGREIAARQRIELERDTSLLEGLVQLDDGVACRSRRVPESPDGREIPRCSWFALRRPRRQRPPPAQRLSMTPCEALSSGYHRNRPRTTNHQPLTVCFGIRPRAGDAGQVRLDQTPDRRHYHHVRREDTGDDHEKIRVEIGKAPHER